MKILRNLKFDVEEIPGAQPGITQRGITINMRSPKGIVRHLQMTTDFIVLRKNDKIVAIDIKDFIALAEQVEPALADSEPKIPENNNAIS